MPEYWYIVVKTRTNTYSLVISVDPITFLLNNDAHNNILIINQIKITVEQHDKLYEKNPIGAMCNLETPTGRLL